MRSSGGRSSWLAAGLAAALAAALVPGVAAKEKDKDKPEAVSAVIAKVNGEDVTKAEFDKIIRANERFFDLTSESIRERLHGKPLADYLFREEVVKIRAVAQMNADALPEMKKAIDAAWEKIKGGADFAEVAKEASQDLSTAPNGGSLGRRQGFFDFVHPFNRVALTLKQGELSEPVLTMFGYHLIKIDKIYPPMEMKPKQVEARHILVYFPAATTPDFRQKVEEAASAAKVEVLDKAYCKKLPTWCAEAPGS